MDAAGRMATGRRIEVAFIFLEKKTKLLFENVVVSVGGELAKVSRSQIAIVDDAVDAGHEDIVAGGAHAGEYHSHGRGDAQCVVGHVPFAADGGHALEFLVLYEDWKNLCGHCARGCIGEQIVALGVV